MTPTTSDDHDDVAMISDEEWRKLLVPNPSVEQIVEVIRTNYYDTDKDSVQITVVKELDSYDDKNLWLSIDGVDYLAKVHNGVESQDLIDKMNEGRIKDSSTTSGNDGYKQSAVHLQNAMMMHLNEHGINTSKPQQPVAKGGDGSSVLLLPTPAVICSLPVAAEDHSPKDLVVRLLGWVPGRPMATFPMLPLEALADAGRFLGRLSLCLSSLSTTELSAAKRYHQWDGKNTADLKDFVHYVTDEKKRSMVISVIEAFQTDLIDSGVAEQSFPKSLIHGDFNDANYLLDDNFCVSGVIDFGDSIESWRILDLSVAMAYSMLTVYGKRNRSLSAAAAMLRGYNAVCPISDVEKRHLLLLIACRLSTSVTLGAYSYSQNPENEYLLLHATPGWNALELIWGNDPTHRQIIRQQIDALFDIACATTGIDCSDLAFPDPSIPDPFTSIRTTTSDGGTV